MKIKYSTNNSGGSWWLKDEDWLALEKAGWAVAWGGYNKEASSFEEAKDNRWLGSVAQSASKEFNSFKEAIEEWEKITGQDASDEGCNCCGAPHSFRLDEKGKYEVYSGEEVLEVKYGELGGWLKEELLKLLKRKV